jgi:hypothetical protein
MKISEPMKTSNLKTSFFVTEIKPYSPAELARVYKVSKKILNGWLDPHRGAIGKRSGLYYTALQVKTIFELIGLPGTIDDTIK